jgi:uncharacterized membrane protein
MVSACRLPRKAMSQEFQESGSVVAAIAFDVLDPVPYGCFVGGLVFDAIYAEGAEVLWVKAAAWLISIGLLFAVLPRLIDLVRIWFPGGRPRSTLRAAGFWLNLLAIAAAITNAFVHSRDAYGVMPEGLWLSCLTIILLVLARVLPALRLARRRVRP